MQLDTLESQDYYPRSRRRKPKVMAAASLKWRITWQTNIYAAGLWLSSGAVKRVQGIPGAANE